MDIIAHALWTTAAATALRQSLQRPVRLGWAAFWGVFPDVVSFSIPAAMRIWWWLTGASKTLLPRANGPHFEWVWSVYNCSHSVLVFAVVFGLAWLLMRRLPLEILGWLLHIVIDIFTHRGLFALRFLWPLSDVHFDGFPWETGWFLVANYGAMAVVFLLLWGRHRTVAARL